MGVKYIFPSGQVLVVKNNNLELRLGKIGQDNSPGGDLTQTSRSVEPLTILKTKQSKTQFTTFIVRNSLNSNEEGRAKTATTFQINISISL